MTHLLDTDHISILQRPTGLDEVSGNEASIHVAIR
jgi:hypothetical protein